MPREPTRRYATPVMPWVHRWRALRRAFADLGPLRPAVVYVAAASTVGMVALVLALPALAARTPTAPAIALPVVVAAIVVAIGAAVLPPAAAALGAGYCLGASPGTAAAVAGVGLGCLLAGQLARRLGAALLPALRERPRAVAVRTFTRGPAAAATLAVARLRWAAVFPFAATNLLFVVVGVPARSVLLGSWLAVVPTALLGAIAGDALRAWRERGAWPEPQACVAAAAAVLAVCTLRRAARRVWRAATSPVA